jgi:hypothetical protein
MAVMIAAAGLAAHAADSSRCRAGALGLLCGCRQGCPIEVARQRGRALGSPYTHAPASWSTGSGDGQFAHQAPASVGSGIVCL